MDMAKERKKEESLRELIYHTDDKIKAWLKRVESDSRIKASNQKEIVRFYESLRAKGRSPSRLLICLAKLRTFAVFCKKDFKDMNRKDMEGVLTRIQEGKGQHGKYSPVTIEMIKTVIKTFYRWLYDLDKRDPLPKCVSWIEGHTVPNGLKKEELLSVNDVVKMICATRDPMKKALISVLFEGGLRPGELLSMRIEDIIWTNGDKITIYVRGKKEKRQGDRKVPLRNSYDLLHGWIDQHPTKSKASSPVWISHKGKNKVLTIENLDVILKRIGKEAGLNGKRIYPYLLRHSRGYIWHKELGEIIAKRLLGHSPDSRMSKVYSHIDDSDTEDAIDERLGLSEPKEKKENYICLNCKHPNAFGNDICSKCHNPVTTMGTLKVEVKEEIQQEDMEILNKLASLLRNNPSILDRLEEKI